ncbi:hypothetical protein WJX82_011674 [Trebouxia sp. C0006]
MHAAVGPRYKAAQSPQISQANWGVGPAHRETTKLANARLNKEQAMSSDTAKTDCKEPQKALMRRQKRLAASQPAPPPMFQQAQLAGGKHQVGLHASSPQPDRLQQQVKQSQAAKQDTEQLYGAFLCAARDEIAAETDAKLMAEEALAAEQSLAHKQEIRLKSMHAAKAL